MSARAEWVVFGLLVFTTVVMVVTGAAADAALFGFATGLHAANAIHNARGS